ncbi:ribonuclease H protein [Pyrus ussuriensis x Pyrus communis]|uniref:Ribonuclease H protein n=1 Tax=Pyrus ussuriensis x Pyrus communis TaxID=2448454 RepID=A0A5N5GAN3_9ROSA|nr:ribonuclease H protein [Pyrus ussuriensis x Pyrus communis]
MVKGGDFLKCWKWVCRKYDDTEDAEKLIVIFEKLVVEAHVALELLRRQLCEIEECGGDKIRGGWTKPPFRTIKLNCDEAWCKQTGQAAGGARNILCESSLMAKAEMMRAALLACVEKGFGIVQLETDSKVMVDMINGVLQPDAVIEGIIWDIQHLKQQLS